MRFLDLLWLRQLSLELFCLMVGRNFHVKVLVQVPGFPASKFNEIFSKLCTTSELLTRQSVRTSTIVPTLLYSSQSLAFLLGSV